MKEFIETQDNTLDEIAHNAMVLFQHNDLGHKIETTLSREIKKTSDVPDPDAPLQLRLRLHNRFNMDLNNIYAIEISTSGGDLLVESSVNVYHDDFCEADFAGLIREIYAEVLSSVDINFLTQRMEFNFHTVFQQWQAASDKKYIKDPQLDTLKEKHAIYSEFRDRFKEQVSELLQKPASDFILFTDGLELEKRQKSFSKSQILKMHHRIPAESVEPLMQRPALFAVLLLEQCITPLFLANELYVMCLIYKRNLDEIRAVLKRRVQER